jgi:hypothetical protein
MQLRGQACALHTRVSAWCEQALPPKRTCTSTERERRCEPAPHDFVHGVQEPKLLSTTQSTGQLWALQLRVSCVCLHATPPLRGCTHVRERICVPVPHERVHVVHDDHCLTYPLSGQACWLQGRVSCVCAHFLPPKRGCVQARVRFCEPLPHDFVQVLQAAQAPTEPSIGQACLLHDRASFSCGQALPPKRGSTWVRERCCDPIPHD